jgi:hypothetical protein
MEREMAIVDDFKAINARVREISGSILDVGKRANWNCLVCSDRGWVLVPDPRIGYPDKPIVCSACDNPRDKTSPFMELENEAKAMEKDAADYLRRATKNQGGLGQSPSLPQAGTKRGKI